MSEQLTAAQHHTKAAEHHEHAALHHKEAAKYYDSGAHEKAAQHAQEHGVQEVTPAVMERVKANIRDT